MYLNVLQNRKKKVLSIQIKCSFTQTLKRNLLYVKKKNPHEISEFASTLVLLFMNILRRYQNTSSQTKANMYDFSHLKESYAYIGPLLRRWFKHWCFPLNIWSIVSSADIWRVALSPGTPASHQNRKWLFLRHLSESGKFFE